VQQLRILVTAPVAEAKRRGRMPAPCATAGRLGRERQVAADPGRRMVRRVPAQEHAALASFYQAEGAAGGREPLFAAATDCPPASAATTAVAGCRSAILDPGEAMVLRLAGRAADCAARDGFEMAPQRLEGLLALALETPGDRRTPRDFGRVADAHPTHCLREPLLGSATDPS
jgi:hypothetical protein